MATSSVSGGFNMPHTSDTTVSELFFEDGEWHSRESGVDFESVHSVDMVQLGQTYDLRVALLHDFVEPIARYILKDSDGTITIQESLAFAYNWVESESDAFEEMVGDYFGAAAATFEPDGLMLVEFSEVAFGSFSLGSILSAAHQPGTELHHLATLTADEALRFAELAYRVIQEAEDIEDVEQEMSAR
jgi:hypothetical protein